MTKENNLQLQWKKTIGILTIVMGFLRLCVCIFYSLGVAVIGGIAGSFSEGSTEIGCTMAVAYAETYLLGGLFILGIILLCIHRGVDNTLPRPKARGVTDCILLSLIIFYILELIPYAVGIAHFSFTTVLSFGYFVPLIVFCILGLVTKPKEQTTTAATSTPISPATQSYPTVPLSPFDDEIEELKKKIELHKLEKELVRINSEKQNELEQLKNELDTIE